MEEDAASIKYPAAKILWVDQALTLNPASAQVSPSKKELTSFAPEHPTPYVLIQLARLAYKDDPCEKLQALQAGKELVGWEVLLRASNPKMFNGYFGIAFWNPSTGQVVIAHRGTKIKSSGAVWTDLFGVVNNKIVGQVLSACTFTQEVVDLMRDKAECFLFTGHSLGGWLASITTYTAQYLCRSGEYYRFNAENPERVRPHTVIFDSPGSAQLLLDIQNACEPRSEKWKTLLELDIVNYVSAPNYINVTNEHVGVLIRIENEPGKIGKLIARIGGAGATQHMRTEHSIKSMIKAFDPANGYLNKSAGAKLVKNWPTLDELKEVWDKVDPATGKPKSSSGSYNPITYETVPFDERECSLISLRKEARQFLARYKALPKQLLELYEPPVHLKQLEDVLQKCDVASDTVKCSSPEELSCLIPGTNKLVAEYPLYVYNIMTSVNKRTCQFIFPVSLCKSTLLFDKSNTMSGLHVVTKEDQSLTLQRVRHALGDIPGLVLNQDHLVITREDDPVERLLKKKYVLVISCDETSDQTLYKEKLKRFHEKGVPLYIVTTFGSEITNVVQNELQLPVLEARPTSWTDISDESKTDLLNKQLVTFQGRESVISLQEILVGNPEPSECQEMFPNEVLCELIKGNELIVGENLKEIDAYYIERTLLKPLRIIDAKAFSVPFTKAQFIVEDIDEQQFRSAFNIRQDNPNTFAFVEASQELKDDSTYDDVYFLLHRKGEFFLKDFIGNINCLKPFLQDTDLTANVTEDDMVNDWSRITIISGEPGAGKSSILTNLAQKIKKQNPSSWVLLINLADFTQLFENQMAQGAAFTTPEDIAHFIAFDMLRLPDCSRHILEFCMLQKKARVTLLIDSFDEVCPDYKQFTLGLLKALLELTNVRRIFVTTRNELKQDLEVTFQKLSIPLALFSEQEREAFLDKRIKTPKTRDSIKSILQGVYVMSLFLKSALNNPLILGMFVEVVTDHALEELNMTAQSIKSLTQLYRLFVQKKIDIYIRNCTDPRGNIHSKRHQKMFLKLSEGHHKILAQRLWFKQYEFPSVKLEEPENLETDVFKIGIIEGNGSTIRFVHGTFSEYFLAEFVFDLLNQDEITFGEHEFLINEYLLNNHMMSRNFFDQMLVIEKCKVPKVTDLENREYHRIYDELGETFAYVAVRESNLEIVKYLMAYFEKNKQVNIGNEFITKSKKNKSVVDCAISNNSYETLDYVLEKVQPLDVDWDELDESGTSPIMNLIRKSFDDNRLESSKFHRTKPTPKPEAERRAILRILRRVCKQVNWSSADNPNRAPLAHHLAFSKNYEMLIVLSEELEDHTYLTVKDFCGYNLVHLIANQKSELEDERALKLEWFVSLMGKYDWTQTENKQRNTVIHMLAWKPEYEMLERLAQDPRTHVCLNMTEALGNTPVHAAFYSDPPNQRQTEARLRWLELINNAFDWRIPNITGSNGLHCVASKKLFGFLGKIRRNVLPECLSAQDFCGNTPLHLAFKAEFPEEEGRMLLEWIGSISEYIDWTITNISQWTVIHSAAGYYHIDELIALTRDPKTHVCLNMAPLASPVYAILSLQTWTDQFIQKLLTWFDSIKDIYEWNLVNRVNRTVLHGAALRSNSVVLTHLVSTNPQTHVCLAMQDDEGNTPVHAAADNKVSQQWFESIQDLYGWTITNDRGRTAIHNLAIERKFQILIKLSSNQSVLDCLKMTDNSGNTPLHHAIQAGTDYEVLQWIQVIFQACDWKLKNSYGQTALHLAAVKGYFQLLTYLFEQANIAECLSEVCLMGFTPIHYALAFNATDDEQEHARILWLKKTYRPELWTEKSICLAAVEGKIKVLQVLPEMLGPTNFLYVSETHFDGTPLHLLMYSKASDEDLMRYIKSNIGADSELWNLTNSNGNTPVHGVARTGRFFVLDFLATQMTHVKYLEKEDNDSDTPVHEAMRKETANENTISSRAAWLKKIAPAFNWKITNKQGETAVHLAAKYQQIDVLVLLAGCTSAVDSFSMKDENGNTPVHLVMRTRKHSPDVPRLLEMLNEFYDWRLTNSYRHTAVHEAAYWSHFDVLIALANMPKTLACLSIKDCSGFTPIQLANIGWLYNSSVHGGSLIRWHQEIQNRGIPIERYPESEDIGSWIFTNSEDENINTHIPMM